VTVTDPSVETLSILPLRSSVLVPASVVPISVGRPSSVRLIEGAGDRQLIGVVTQRDAENEDPSFDDIYQVGTVARVLKTIRLSSGKHSAVLHGIARMRIVEELERAPWMRARVERVEERPSHDVEIDALAAQLRESARALDPEQASAILDVQDPGALADLVAVNLKLPPGSKQEVLETFDRRARLRKVIELVARQAGEFRAS